VYINKSGRHYCEQPEQSSRVSRAAGFTILELMIASAVFAIILLVVAVGVISFTNSYYKGITSSDAQATARAIMSEVSQSLEFGQNWTKLSANGAVDGYCVDNTLYSYELGQQVTNSSPNSSQDQGYHGLVVTNGSASCQAVTPSLPNSATLPASSRELLNQNMRLGAFDITQVENQLFSIRVEVIYGDNDLLSNSSSLPNLGATQWGSESCAGGTGSQFCAVSDLTTTVEQRLI